MSGSTESLTIGRLAKAANVNIETVRHYQRKSLIQEPKKPLSGFRHYPQSTIERIRFIKRAQQLGFSLKEIAQLLELGSQHCDEVKTLANEKRKIIQKQIEGLKAIQSALDEMITSCNTKKNVDQCAFIDTLSRKGFLEGKK